MIDVSKSSAMKCKLRNGLSYSNGQEKFLARGKLDAVSVQLTATLLEEENKVLSFSSILGVFPVDINTVETQVLYKLDGAAGKLCSSGSRRSRLGKVDRISPTSNGEESLELPVTLLEKEKLFDTAVNVVAGETRFC